MTSGMEPDVQDDRGASHEEARLAQLLETVRDPSPAPPWFSDRVMARVRAEEERGWRTALNWFLRPREVRVSPASGLAVALAAMVFLWVLPGDPGAGPVAVGDASAAAPATQVVTRFVFVAPQAASVRLTGDFLDWDGTGLPLADARGNGVWMVDLPLDPGVYQYAFVVDGSEWRPDPLAVSQVDDGFGRQNSVVIVTREI